MELPHQVAKILRTLRLYRILETLEVRNRQAAEQRASFVEFLTQRGFDILRCSCVSPAGAPTAPTSNTPLLLHAPRSAHPR